MITGRWIRPALPEGALLGEPLGAFLDRFLGALLAVLLGAVLTPGMMPGPADAQTAPLPANAQTAPDSPSLEQCLAEAFAAPAALRGARERLEASRAAARSAQAERWPTLDLGGDYRYASKFTTIDLPLPPPVGPRRIDFGDGHQVDLSVGVRTPLYTGGALAASAAAARAEARANDLDVAADSLALVRDVRAGFFRALGARAESDAAAIAVSRLQRHLTEVENAIGIGTSSEETRLQVEARLRVAEQRAIADDMNLTAAELTLGRLLGRTGVRVAPQGDLATPLLGSPGEIGEIQRPELQALSERRTRRELDATAAAGRLLPSVSAGARFNYGRPGVDPVQNEWMSWASADVRLSWTLWDWSARRDAVASARAAARAVDDQRSALERDIENGVAVARERLDSTSRHLENAEDRLRIEQSRLDLVRGRYDDGMATESELLDAHDDLSEAETDLAAARVANRLAEIELLYAVGR